jgi:hypothetical protein
MEFQYLLSRAVLRMGRRACLAEPLSAMQNIQLIALRDFFRPAPKLSGNFKESLSPRYDFRFIPFLEK